MRLAVAVALLCACGGPNRADPTREDGDPGDGTFVSTGIAPPSPHLALGVPSDTTPDDDALVMHDEFVAGYSRFLNASNWVSWRTRRADYGPADRFDGNFYADDTLPAEWYHPVHDDYTGSGFDRGHMVRSEERTRSDAANFATFVMTNVLAQRADLNRGVWFDFESYIQDKVEGSGVDAYMLAGPYWPAACATHVARVAGDGCRDVGRETDPTHRIAVPESTWKIVVFVNAGQPIESATEEPYVLAVVMPNIEGISRDHWYEYRTPVAEIEAATGYDFTALQ
jgi:endonuclease G